jgi:SAM-dependent MidA family methyltransferase
MQFTDTLPMPPDDALAHCNQLIHTIKAEIEQNPDGISFRRFMEMALYEPSLGYYVAGMRKIGKSGNFVTAPEISTLFSQCLANQCQQVLQSLVQGSILELGAGSGIMAADMLQHLEQQQCLPEQYYILDISPELKQRQRETLQKQVPHLIDKVIWLDQLPENFIGVIVGNEVLDAMPVDLFSIDTPANLDNNDTSTMIYNNHVIWKNDYFALKAVPASSTLQQQVQALNIDRRDCSENYTSEINPNLPAWCASISECLQQGVILLIDYGYTQSEYYLPERCMGTLICHYQHRSHNNPLIYPSLQDITANVDFTAVAHAASDAQLDVLGFSNQATFLAASGLETCFLAQLQQQPKQQYHLAQQIRTLSLPAEMGERFKVIALGKEFQAPLSGFSLGDQRHRL